MNLLSVDWDFFFHDKAQESTDESLCYDWGHMETPTFIHKLWELRAAQFIKANIELPMTTGEERNFWRKVNISKEAKLFFAESHSAIAQSPVIKGVDKIWNLDAHHDAYRRSSGGVVMCDNWAHWAFVMGIEVTTRYPEWRVDNAPMETVIPMDIEILNYTDLSKQVFDRVFICRSGAWAPSWLDKDFEKFVAKCPAKIKVCLDGKLPKRKFDCHGMAGIVTVFREQDAFMKTYIARRVI